MNNMKRPANISFLLPKENECMELLMKAQELFDILCHDDPQNSMDAYNFGHYIDAAKQAVLLRGCRRLDPENLMHTHAVDEVSSKAFDTMLANITVRRHTPIVQQRLVDETQETPAEQGGVDNVDPAEGD